MDKKSIGRHLRQQRESRGLSQERLSERLGISPMYYSSIERGVRSPSLELFIRIANELGASADVILEDMLECGVRAKASRLGELIAALPAADGRQVLAVVEAMLASRDK